MSEEEVEVIIDDPTEEIVLEIPIMEGSGSYMYVCSECGGNLTEIPYYNRFFCENCGLHY